MRIPKIPLQIPPGILKKYEIRIFGVFFWYFRGIFSIPSRRGNLYVGLVFLAYLGVCGVFCSVAGLWVVKTRARCLLHAKRQASSEMWAPLAWLLLRASSLAIHSRTLAHACHGQAVANLPGRAGISTSTAGFAVLPGQAWWGHPLFWAVHPRGGNLVSWLWRGCLV